MKVYIGIFSERGQVVYEDEAEEYIKERGFQGDGKVLIPWFFSGNWIEKESRNRQFQSEDGEKALLD